MEANEAVSGGCRPQQSMGFPPPQRSQPLPCPRCHSTATKFCYYNNYNLSQPRYLCKSCRRYWTHGGTLRNVPVGGATRKISKRSRASSSSSVLSTTTAQPPSSDCPSLGLSGFSYEFDHGDVGAFPDFTALPASDYNEWDDLTLPHHPPNSLN